MAQLLTGLCYTITEEDDVHEGFSYATVKSRDSFPTKRTIIESSSRSTRYRQSTIEWEANSDGDGHNDVSMEDEEGGDIVQTKETLKNWAS